MKYVPIVRAFILSSFVLSLASCNMKDEAAQSSLSKIQVKQIIDEKPPLPVPSLIISEKFGQKDDQPVPGDYDGDGKHDLAVVRRVKSSEGESSTLHWYIRGSKDGSFLSYVFGENTNNSSSYEYSNPIYPSVDFDGDGKADLAILFKFQSRVNLQDTKAQVKIRMSRTSEIEVLNLPTDVYTLVVRTGDFDGDGRADLAAIGEFGPKEVHRWDIYKSGKTLIESFELGGGGYINGNFPEFVDVHVTGDFDGDKITDAGIVRYDYVDFESSLIWNLRLSSTKEVKIVPWGKTTWAVLGVTDGIGSGIVSVAPDLDGDGKSDLVVKEDGLILSNEARISQSIYHVRSVSEQSEGGFIKLGLHWGYTTDNDVIADYDGDGRSDMAVFRQKGLDSSPENAPGTWFAMPVFSFGL